MKIFMTNLLEEPRQSLITTRCNVVIIELVGYEEVETNKRWVAVIKRGFEIIEKKNQTSMLVDIPTHKKH